MQFPPCICGIIGTIPGFLQHQGKSTFIAVMIPIFDRDFSEGLWPGFFTHSVHCSLPFTKEHHAGVMVLYHAIRRKGLPPDQYPVPDARFSTLY